MDALPEEFKTALPRRPLPSCLGAGWRRRASALAMFASVAVLSGNAEAQQNLYNINTLLLSPIAQKHLQAVTVDPSNVFATRWPMATDTFVLSADGVLRASNHQGAGRNQDTPFDSLFAKMAKSQNRRATTIAGIRNDDAGQDGLATEANDCGPSAATPDEVKTLIDNAAAKHGVDAMLAEAIAWSESSFDRSRNSPKGARGPMQLMPATALELGVHDVCDPADNIDGGVRHLRAMLDEFKNPLLAAAAYNAGAEPIYRYGGIPPYPETVSFVARVVDFTLGLKTVGRRSIQPTSEIGAAADAEIGVITRKKPGEFVGGVMQF